MKYSLFIFFLTLIISSCRSDHPGQNREKSEDIRDFSIMGSLNEGRENLLFFEELTSGGFIHIDTIRTDKEGYFRFKHAANFPTLYALRVIEGNKVFILPRENENIFLRGNYTFDEYKLNGSPDSEAIADLHFKTRQFLQAADTIAIITRDSIKSPDYKKIKIKLIAEYDSLYSALRQYSIDFIEKNLESPVTIFALNNKIGPDVYVFDIMADIELYSRTDSILYNKFPDFPPLKTLHNKLNVIKLQLSGKKSLNVK